MADEMNGVRKLRVIADMEYSLARSHELKDLADEIEREHMDEINVCLDNEAKLINRIERLRKAIEYALNPDADREEASGCVEEHGGLVAVQERICSFARMLNSVDSIVCGDEQHCFGERVDLGEADELFGVIYGELDKRLMPQGMEWPRFEDGERVEFGSAVDGLDSPCEKFIFTRSMGGVCQLQDAGGNMVNVLHGERVKRPVTEVLGADGLPLKVGETVYHNGGMFEVQVVREGAASDEFGEWYDSCLLTHTQPITQSGIDKYVDDALRCAALMMISEDAAKSLEDRVKEALRCQRELDAKTTGGE